MKELLTSLFQHHTLSRDEAYNVLHDIGNGAYTPIQISAFVTVFQMRSITPAELTGFRDALLALCKPVSLNAYQPIDLCGTGGDGKDTFNISTLASFVVAGAGIHVAKHGNYGVSSVCGSSNVLEYFGYQFTNDESQLEKQLSEAGICFLHAPLFHPAMKHVAPVRRELSVKTFFNMLGPMVNPVRPAAQLTGVYSLELARLYQYLFQETETQYTIVHALDGYDEISLTGPFKVLSTNSEKILRPEDVGLTRVSPAEITGGHSVQEAAQIFERILRGDGTQAQNDVVCINAALAIHCARPLLSLEQSLMKARESLLSGNALLSFTKLIAS